MRLCIHVFRRVGEAGFAAQPTIERGESPDDFFNSARDPLPLRLCVSIFQQPVLCARSTTQTALRAVIPLPPPAPEYLAIDLTELL